MIFDTHMHTAFSTDSSMLLSDALKRAERLGIGIVTTEHMDLNYPEPGKFIFDTGEYFSAYQTYRSEIFLLGIEIGMAESCMEKNKLAAQSGKFDYVLGSIHTVDDLDIYYEPFYRGKSKQDAYEEYFRAMADCLDTHAYIDALGHIDYIARYARYQDTEIVYGDFTEAVDEVLRRAINNNILMEVNTRRFHDRQAVKTLLPIFKRYYELGGREVTLGSDAHKAQDIGAHFSEALAFIEECKLKQAYFVERKMKTMC